MADILATCDWVFEHARRRPDAPAVDSLVHRLSYRQLAERTLRVARVLRRLGVQEGERVLVALANVPAAVVLALAVQHVGAVCVPVGTDWSAEQVVLALAQTRARALVVARRDVRRLASSLSGDVRVIVVGDDPGGRDGVRKEIATPLVAFVSNAAEPDEGDGAPLAAASPARRPDSPTLLLYTSGSTGRPRAVVQTLGNVDANSRSIVAYLELTERDRAMLILPLSYCYGRSVLQTHLMVGGSVFLDPRFMYPALVLGALTTEHCTGFAGVPLTFELLRRRAHPEPAAMPELRYVTQAGGAMSEDTIAWTRAAFAPAQLFVMYGQTEATARLAYLPPTRAGDKHGSIGVPIAGVELRVVDDEGRDVQRGERGHLIAQGANVTPGYFEAEAETAAVLRDGWLWTGDLARQDEDGFFYVVGRAKEILKIGGHRVSPAEIESVLVTHPDVAEAAVAGIADALTGEAAGALVVLRPGGQVSSEALQRHCTERLAHHLVPRLVRFAAGLPRSTSGKLLRAQVAIDLAAPG